MYLPGGEWFDFWTGRKLSGPKSFEPEIPPDRGGPLFVRAGAIIPMGPEMQYVGQRPDDELTVHIFPGASGEFVFYEDDGRTHDYEKGASRTTEIRHETRGGQLRIEIAAAAGNFPGAPPARRLQFVVHGLGRPSRVELAGAAQPPAWAWDDKSQSLSIFVGERQAKKKTTLTVAAP